MKTSAWRPGAALLVAALLTGCAETFPFITTLHSEERYLMRDSTVLTEADKRAIVNVNQSTRGHGMVVPDRIVCAEPSPDVAKALSEGISAAISADVQGQGSGEFQGSRSFAESIAQLGERLGTIQLLRDGFYRACEAYANGAISDTTYAMIVSGTDDVMTTLLASEVAAGAFGRQLAAIGGQATASTAAVVADKEAVKRHQDKLTDLRKERGEKETERNQAQTDENEAKVKELNAEIAGLDKAIESEEKHLRDATKAAASSSAGATIASGIGTIGVRSATGGPEAVENIHRNFIRATNLNAFIKACVTTLDRRAPGNQTAPETKFAEVCERFFGVGGGTLSEDSQFYFLLRSTPAHKERMALIEALPEGLLAQWIAICTKEEDREKNKEICEPLKQALKSITEMETAGRQPNDQPTPLGQGAQPGTTG